MCTETPLAPWPVRGGTLDAKAPKFAYVPNNGTLNISGYSIDPATGEPLPDGEEGELVLTTLSKKAMPMIRYRTRDITALLPGVMSMAISLPAVFSFSSTSIILTCSCCLSFA